MATYLGYLRFKSGKTISLYYASAVAAGTFLPVRADGADAGSTDGTNFMVNRPEEIVDFITTNTAGAMQLCVNGDRVPYTLPTTAAFAASVANRVVPGAILNPGRLYSFVMTTAGAS